MANKGLQYEWALLYYVKDMIVDKTPTDIAEMNEAKLKMGGNYEVIQSAQKMITKILDTEMSGILNPITKNDVWKSFTKLSGGDEPKTDIYFKIGIKEYKCSVKYGPNYQLSSGGIKSSTKLIESVVNKMKADNNITIDNAKLLLGIVINLDKFANVGVKRQSEIKTLLNPVRVRSGADKFEYMSLQEQLQYTLGSGRKKTPAEAFIGFKYALVYEALTGEHTFKNNPIKAANYVLNEYDLVPITEDFAKSVMNKASARISMKGRNKKIENGKEIRYNEITVRIDAKR